MTRGIAILGATGSIGASALDVIRRHPNRFHVASLSANTDVDTLVSLSIEFRPQRVAIADPRRVDRLAAALREADIKAEVLSGPSGLESLASDPAADTVVAAIVGAAGLGSTLAAARSGKRILLANKEAVVLAGALLLPAMVAGGGELLPIDSEHNAIFQCLPRDYLGNPDHHGVERVLLTASGGPLLRLSSAELDAVTPEVACAHPNWRMGRKISVDSATLMNKGLEVIEAHWLFGVPASRIEVVVHPQSIIHSLVAYRDGSLLAQLGQPDMRTAIAYGLGWPERIDAGVASLDLTALGKLEFEAPDHIRFPALNLAYAALAAGGTAPGILNAANEVAVDAFLNGRIRFPDIVRLVETTLATLPPEPVRDLDQLLAVDRAARETAHGLIPECA